MPQRELELGSQQRERRPQLVAGVGDERALAHECGLEPGEHRVERLAQPLDLVARLRHGQALARRSAEIAAARRRIDSTGRSASPASP